MEHAEGFKLAKNLITGGFASLLIHLVNLQSPIIVGGGYPKDKLLEQFELWAKELEFDTTTANLQMWREACKAGFFKGDQ